jgi:hypothetical protein
MGVSPITHLISLQEAPYAEEDETSSIAETESPATNQRVSGSDQD